MEEQITHLVINWISIEKQEILIGATDNQRWDWDKEAGMSGVDAKTIVFVTLTDNGKGYAVSEKAGFHCLPGDKTRRLAMSNVFALFDIAWTIKNEDLDLKTARKMFFGEKIK